MAPTMSRLFGLCAGGEIDLIASNKVVSPGCGASAYRLARPHPAAR
jgi:hypothetical protein